MSASAEKIQHRSAEGSKGDGMTAGIYFIRNKRNGHLYIGSSKNVEGRLRTHKFQLCKGSHRNLALQEDFKHWGSSAFDFRLVLSCASCDLRDIEQQFITNLHPFYNVQRRVAGRRKK